MFTLNNIPCKIVAIDEYCLAQIHKAKIQMQVRVIIEWIWIDVELNQLKLCSDKIK